MSSKPVKIRHLNNHLLPNFCCIASKNKKIKILIITLANGIGDGYCFYANQQVPVLKQYFFF